MFTQNVRRIGVTPRISFQGYGFLAGEAPTGTGTGDPDGRFKVLNVPGRGRINVHERSSMVCVRSTVSAPDGTWRVDYIDASLSYVVIGFDDRGQVNAAIQDWIKPAIESA